MRYLTYEEIKEMPKETLIEIIDELITVRGARIKQENENGFWEVYLPANLAEHYIYVK